MSRPNEETFRIRARALLEEQGAARLARRYGVSESTIRNYAAGRSTPRSARTMRNITRAGRRITGAAVQVRDSQGRLLDQALKELEASESDSAEVMQFVKCIRNSRVGIMRGPVDE